MNVRRWLFGSLLLFPLISLAQDATPQTGQEIMEEQVRRYRDGVRTEFERFTMEHGLASGQPDRFDEGPDRSEMTRLSRYTDEGDTSMTQIDGPAGSSGIGLKVLSYEEQRRDRRVWHLYVRLPDDPEGIPFTGASENKRVNSSGLTYRDLKFLENRQVLQDYTYELLREETVERIPCYILRARPNSGVVCEYAQIDLWIRKDVFFTVKIVTYDTSRTSRPWKTFLISGLARADIGEGRRVIRATQVDVRDERDRYRTVLQFSSRRVNVDVDLSVFTEGYVDSREVRTLVFEDRR